MASTHCALSPFFPHSSQNSITATKPQASLPSLTNPTKRKNHLRPKLLKTLTKPYHPIPQNPNETSDLDTNNKLDTYTTPILDEFEFLIEQEEEQLQISTTTPEPETALTTRSVTELVFYVVGLFVVQTVITVWVLRSNDADKKSENDEKKEGFGFWFGTSSKEVEHKEEPGSFVHADESKLGEKIDEIRAMAKEVREMEAKKLSNSDEDVGLTEVKTSIEKEVDGKLGKLEKRLRSVGEKSLVEKVTYLNSLNEVKDEELEQSDGNVRDESLVFKKKLKFKSAPAKPSYGVKGIQGDENYRGVTGNAKTIASESMDDGSGTEGENGGFLGRTSLEEETRSELDRKEEEVKDSSSKELGSTQEVGNKTGSSPVKEETVSKLGRKEEDNDSSGEELGSTKEIGKKPGKEEKSLKRREHIRIEKNKPRSGADRESSDELVEPNDLSKWKTNSSSISKQLGNNIGDKQASIENDMWWLNLPYALAILLRRSSENEGPGGLYSLKMDDGGSSSHIVAFEDQRDASNFCFILEAFFNELGDLIADVVPLSIEELKDEVEARAMKVIVVRKGQLQLYAGQSLADVEKTLRSLLRH